MCFYEIQTLYIKLNDNRLFAVYHWFFFSVLLVNSSE